MNAMLKVALVGVAALFTWFPTLAVQAAPTTRPAARPSTTPSPLERDVEQLTFQGVNGEGYYSPDGKRFIFQSYGRKAHAHTQIYLLDLTTKKERRLSHHSGDDTCSYFHPTNPNLVLFASTYQEVKETKRFRKYDPEVVAAKKREAQRKAATQPAKKKWTMKRRRRKYKWMYKPYEVYLFDLKGNMKHRLTHAPGYDAEGTFATDGKQIIFSSRRDGDQELYVMNADGTGQQRLTWRRGNDGGAFFSPDGTQVTWRSFDRRGNAQVMVADWKNNRLTNIRQLTHGKGIHWAPFWHPGGKWILFSSNHESTYNNRRNFELYLIDTKGTCQKKLTSHPSADVLPVFSPDGKWIAFTSKRVGGKSQIFRMPFAMPQGCSDPKANSKTASTLTFPPKPTAKAGHKHSYRRYRHYRRYRRYRHYRRKQHAHKHRSSHHHAASKKGHAHKHGKSPHAHKHGKSPHAHKHGKRPYAYKHGKSPHAHRYGAYRRGKRKALTTRKASKATALLRHPLVQDLAFLASPFLEGRDAGTRGIDIAANYIAHRFRALGLKPGGEKASFFQAFSTTLGVSLAAGNAMRTGAGQALTSWKVDTDFVPFGFSATGSFQGKVVFAGYGVTAPRFGYDDYKGLDVKGKFVLLLRYTPLWRKKGKHPWKQRRDLYAAFRYKILNARAHGAKGVLIANLPAPKGKKVEKLVPLSLSRGLTDAGVPALHIQPRVANALLRANGTTLQKLYARMERTQKPASVALSTQVAGVVRLKRNKATVRNVIGVLPGKHPQRKKEAIVIGAHYDHLGYGKVGSFPGNKGKIHPGADDNASGTAAMIDIARRLAKEGTDRTVIFLAFAGEERGLLGSAHYMNHPTVPVKQMITMLNLDMVGRMRNRRLVVQGSATSPVFGSILREISRDAPLRVKIGPSGYGPSDHTSFYARKVPVLFFFTGAHTEYHRPNDTFDRLNLPGVLKIASFVTRVAKTLDQLEERPAYRKVKAPRSRRKIRGGMRAYLGTIPDYGSKVQGVKLTGVRDKGPADKAGIQGGDTIVQIGRFPIRNLYDMVFALRDYQAGDKVTIVVKRKGKKVSLKATFGARHSRNR